MSFNINLMRYVAVLLVNKLIQTISEGDKSSAETFAHKARKSSLNTDDNGDAH